MRNRAELRRALAALPRPLGLVPTMGWLHAGHRSLIARARDECGAVAVSIFVNPRQFEDPADLARYPRGEARDLALEGWFLGVQGLQCLADLPDFGPESGTPCLGNALSRNDQRAGVDGRKVLASRTAHFGLAVPLCLADRNRLTGQE